MALTPKQTIDPNTGKALAEHKRLMTKKLRDRISDMNATENGPADDDTFNWGDGHLKPNDVA